MGLRANPTQRQRRLGYELRRLREATGLKAADAGEHAKLGGPHLRHIEGGRTAIPEDKLHLLLDLYGCTRQTYVRGLLDLHAATGRGWWHSYRRDIADQARDLAELESMSRSLAVFEPLHIPGLLQAPDYAKAILESANSDREAARHFHEFRLNRQEIFSREPALEYHAIIHEAALHMQFVGTDVLRSQITHLIEVSQLPHVTVQIVPFKSEVLPAVGNPFSIFGGTDPELSTVLLEHDVGSVFLYDHDRVTQYGDIFSRLARLALPPLAPACERKYTSQRDSLSLLQHLLYIL